MSATPSNHYLWLYHIPLFSLNNILTASSLISDTDLSIMRVSKGLHEFLWDLAFYILSFLMLQSLWGQLIKQAFAICNTGS